MTRECGLSAALGSFCRDGFACVTRLPPRFRDKPLMNLVPSHGTPIAGQTYVWNPGGVCVMSVSSMSSIGGATATGSQSSTSQSKSKPDPLDPVSSFGAMMRDGTPYDEVKVDLPNGMSVGI